MFKYAANKGELAMRLCSYIDSNFVFTDLCPKDRQELLSQLAQRISTQLVHIDSQTLLNCLLEREKKSSTGLEYGIAVPHAMLPGIQQTICSIARLDQPIEYETMDGSPVRLVFLLLSPPDSIATHIRILARIARLCSIPDFPQRMLEAKDARDLFDIIKAEDDRHV